MERAVFIPPEYDIEHLLLTGERFNEICFSTQAMRELYGIWMDRREALIRKWKREYPRVKPWAVTHKWSVK